MSRFIRFALWPLFLLLSLLPTLALADLPARVGRLAEIENTVNFRVDRSSESGPASINWPISTGALLDTEWRGLAEVWIGSSAFRIAGNSEVEFIQVDDQRITLDVARGSLAVSIMDHDQAADLTVTTPEGRVRFTTPGRYRIDVLSDHSEVTTQAGQATVDDRNNQVALTGGEKARLYQGQRIRIDRDFDQDTFDSWVADRENATMASTSRRHVSPQMTGYQDLDTHGDWRPDAEYGTVWYPRTVADDWAPYRFGRWAWVAPWGWTWIDQAPWGFAPFHYGRWVLIHNRWAWTPGRTMQRPVYAPALVGWVGNPGWNVSFNFGSAPAVGWFPLAPHEVYVPSYRYSPTYIRQININHVQNVRRIEQAARPDRRDDFVHRHQQRAVTIVPASLLREGRTISNRELRRPERRDLDSAPQFRQAPNNNWLAPAASAIRPHRDERRDMTNERPRRGDEQSARRAADERPSPRRENSPVAVETLPIASPQAPENRRELRENRRPERFQAQENTPPAVQQREATPPTPAQPAIVPPVRVERQSAPNPAAEQQDRGLQGIVRRAQERQAEMEPPVENTAVMPSIRALRERPVAPPDKVTPQPRREERQVAPNPDREQRDFSRDDRGASRQANSPAFRQRDAAPPAQPVAQPQAQPAPPPMRETPRQEARPEQPAFRQREAAPPAQPTMRPPPSQPVVQPQAQPAPPPMREAPRQEARPEQKGGEREKRRWERHDDQEERGRR